MEAVFGAQNEDDTVEGIYNRLRVRGQLLAAQR
jgi:hypothetical protein